MTKSSLIMPQDEFALEMRNHFLETTEQSLVTLQDESVFQQRFSELALEWAGEASGNEMPFLSELLKQLAGTAKADSEALIASSVCQGLVLYLKHLRSQVDSEELTETFLPKSDSAEQASKNRSVTSMKNPMKDSLKTYLQCRRGKYSFLLPVENVVEISRHKKISSLPFAEPKVKGLIGFRGQGTPVLDLTYAGYEGSDEVSYFVICEHNKNFFALEVNGTDEVLKLEASDFQASSDGAEKQFTTKDKKILILLNIEKLVAA